MQNIIERMLQRPLVFDGAMGTMIYERGVFINTCYDELNLTNPDLIQSIHRDYIQSGAQVIETNSFGANRIKLAPYGLAQKTVDINRAAVANAKKAAGSDAYVVGSVGPCTMVAQVLTPETATQAREAFTEQIGALVDAGVDAIQLETFYNVEEFKLAIDVAAGFPVPLIASFTVDHEGVTPTGTSAEAIAQELDTLPAVGAIGINCGTGPAGAFTTLEKIIHLTTKPVIVMPNAGLPRQVGGRLLYLSNPEYFTTYAQRYIELGARGVGGCCGTTPAHIELMARTIGSLSGVKHHVQVHTVAKTAQAVTVVEPSRKSRLAAKILAGEKVTSVEILPPRTVDMKPLIAKARKCADAGIDAINIPDGPRASTRVSPMISALTIEREAGIETVLHYCCRDRNLIGMQADLLGAQAAGLRNMLLITGDPPKLGNYPDATGVFDVDAIGLTQTVNNLNHGFDVGGNPVLPPTSFLIGVGANPCAIDLDREIERYFRKIDAGAEFAITQPVFDPQALFRFLDKIEKYQKRIPIIAGVWPLTSLRNAEFMNSEVPGVVVTASILERLGRCTTPEDGAAMGTEIAREIVAAISPRVAGFQVSAPFGKVELALAVLAR